MNEEEARRIVEKWQLSENIKFNILATAKLCYDWDIWDTLEKIAEYGLAVDKHRLAVVRERLLAGESVPTIKAKTCGVKGRTITAIDGVLSEIFFQSNPSLKTKINPQVLTWYEKRVAKGKVQEDEE